MMFDQSLKPVAQWDFKNAWPSKISGPQPKADGNDISLEDLTIVHEYIVRTK
ncbi:MAG: phage tail protein [Anaerolineae bacterium]|nr:phage tail protein [Anaerolineae bacterium]